MTHWEQVIARCAGLDVHKATVAVYVRVPGDAGKRKQEVRTFGMMTADLLTLRDWLRAHRVTDVALESIDLYWKPIYNVLETPSAVSQSTSHAGCGCARGQG